MKRSISRITICIMLCAALISALFIPFISAETVPLEVPDAADREKLLAFWQQEAYNGLCNGDAVYDYAWEHDYPDETQHPSYDGTWSTELIEYSFEGYGPIFGWERMAWYYDEDTGIFTDYYVRISPDLYGTLDLSGSEKLTNLGTTNLEMALRPGQTHIESVDLDGASLLRFVIFDDQYHCTSFSALNCPMLQFFSVTGCPCSSLSFSPKTFELPVQLHTFGCGAVGAEYAEQDGNAIAHAYPGGEFFVGWFDENGLVSDEPTLSLDEGSLLYACFGGDMNFDGDVTVSDAILALRAAMGLTDSLDTGMADINGSGGVDIADSILILRFAMRLL